MYETCGVTPQQATTPAGWEWLAILPLMLTFTILFMAFKLASKILEPEFVREIKPIAEAAAVKRLPGGS